MFWRARAKTSEVPVAPVDSKFDELKRRAEGGDSRAQFELGLNFARGKEGQGEYVEPDYAEAARWWRMAADQGDKRAITNLGFLYASLLLESANGDKSATSNIGIFYARGLRGRAANEREAVECWRRAAALDHPAAQFELAMWHYEKACAARKNEGESLEYFRGPNSLKEWQKALHWLHAAAGNEHAEAQLWLGDVYRSGRNVRKDEIEAIRWLRAASRQEALATYGLAEIYAAGEGTIINAAEAIRWLLEAAHAYDLNADRAQQALGYLYACGDILPIDFDEAAKWWRLAAIRDRWDWERPDYVFPWRERSASEAWAWLCDAAANGSEIARTLLGFFPSVLRRHISEDEEMEEWRKSISKDKEIDEHATELAGATQGAAPSIDGKILGFIVGSWHLGRDLLYGLMKDEAASRFLQECEKQDDPEALFVLGMLEYYRTHRGGDEGHDAEAAKCLLKAAEKGMTPAFRILAEMYEWGSGVPRDKAASARWYRKAAEHGDVKAQYQLATLCVVERDAENDPEAIRWYNRAAKQGHAQAQYKLAQRYERATGVQDGWTRRRAEAFKWYRYAAEQGYAPAQHALGCIYQREEFPLHGYEEAAEWFLKSARQGNEQAQRELSWAYFLGRGAPYDGAEAAKWLRLASEDRYT